MRLQPYLVGRGAAAQAIEKALRILQVTDPELPLLPTQQLARGEPLPTVATPGVARVALLAQPHALHADAILEADAAGFDLVFAEKPVAVSLAQVEALRAVRVPVAVFHGYRVAWGPEALRARIVAGELGDVFAVEGRYWSASSAVAALEPARPRKWKDDPALSGPGDVLLDLAPHWVDLAAFLAGAAPLAVTGWRSYANGPSPHRDTHLQLQVQLAGGVRAQASVSKTVHGAGNDLEVHVLGTRGTGSWRFMDPDRLQLAHGREARSVAREDARLGGRQWPFHGLGWLEGYVEILRRGLLRVLGEGAGAPVPDLASSLSVMEPLLVARLLE